VREDCCEVGKSNLRSCEFIKNLLEDGIFGSISMKEEASSQEASTEILKEELSRL
jgi:hypothetical protein